MKYNEGIEGKELDRTANMKTNKKEFKADKDEFKIGFDSHIYRGDLSQDKIFIQRRKFYKSIKKESMDFK